MLLAFLITDQYNADVGGSTPLGNDRVESEPIEEKKAQDRYKAMIFLMLVDH